MRYAEVSRESARQNKVRRCVSKGVLRDLLAHVGSKCCMRYI